MTSSLGNQRRLTVLLTTEGTYPHYPGGVSTWCDQLIRGAHDTDFIVWSLMMNPFIKEQFELPSNVVSFVGVPLWGVEQPAEYTREISSGRVFESSRRTKEADVERHFLPLFETFLDQTMAALFQPSIFAEVLAQMHEYFQRWEYRTTWRSRPVWEAFKHRLLADAGHEYVRPLSVEADRPLVPRLSDLGTSFKMLAGGSNGNGQYGDASLEDVPLFGEAIEGLRWLYRLMQALNVQVPESDITHSAAAAFCAIPCILSKVQRGTPFLLTEHGVYLREQYLNIERGKHPFNLKRFLINLVSAVSQTSFALADQVSPVCKFNARWETAYGTDPERIRVIYNGVSPDTYRPMPEVQRRSGPTVVQVSRIDPLKDQLTLMRVADLVRREIPNVQFHQYGPVADDEYFEDVQELHKQLNLGDTVKFLGETNKVAEAYATGDVAIMTSISEAFPFGAVEPLMCGKPVVSTAVGGVREALDGTGATAPARDPEGLAAAVVQMLRATPEEAADMSVRARQRAVDHFTLAQFIEAYSESYRNLDAQRGEAHPVETTFEDVPLTDEQNVLHPETAAARPETAAARPETAAARPETAAARPEIAAAARPEIAETTPVYEMPQAVASEELEPRMTDLPDEPFNVDDIRSYEGLVAAIAADDPFVRMRAIAGAMPMPGIEEALMPSLDDPHATVRRETVRALARLGGVRIIGALLATAESDPSAEVRQAAVEALGPLLPNGAEDMGAGGA